MPTATFRVEPETVRIEVTPESSDRVRLRLRGEIDLMVEDELFDFIAGISDSNSVTEMVLDYSGITFIDSAGINLALRVRGYMTGKRVSLRLVQPPSPYSHLFALTDTDRLFEWD